MIYFKFQVDTSANDSVMINSQLLQYTPSNAGAPLAFVVTEFHALLLYPDHVKGISLLNHDLVFEDIYNEVFSITLLSLISSKYSLIP